MIFPSNFGEDLLDVSRSQKQWKNTSKFFHMQRHPFNLTDFIIFGRTKRWPDQWPNQWYWFGQGAFASSQKFAWTWRPGHKKDWFIASPVKIWSRIWLSETLWLVSLCLQFNLDCQDAYILNKAVDLQDKGLKWILD